MSGACQQTFTDEDSQFLRGVNEGYRTWCLRNQKIQWLLRALESASPQEGNPKLDLHVQQLKAMTIGQVEDSDDDTSVVFKGCEAVPTVVQGVMGAHFSNPDKQPEVTDSFSKDSALDDFRSQMHRLDNQVDMIMENTLTAKMDLKERYDQRFVVTEASVAATVAPGSVNSDGGICSTPVMPELLPRQEAQGTQNQTEEKYENMPADRDIVVSACNWSESELDRVDVKTLSDVLAEGVTDPGEREEILKREHAGSAAHPHGCRPCHFQGGLCWKGLSCSFCHICPKPKRKSKHQRDVDKRRQERYRQVKEDLGIKCLEELTKVDDARRQFMESSEDMKKRIKDAYSSGDSCRIAEARDMLEQMMEEVRTAYRADGNRLGNKHVNTEYAHHPVDAGKLRQQWKENHVKWPVANDPATDAEDATAKKGDWQLQTHGDYTELNAGQGLEASQMKVMGKAGLPACNELQRFVLEASELTTTDGSAGSASDLSDEEPSQEKPMPRMQGQTSADRKLAEIRRLQQENDNLLSFMCEMVGQHPDRSCVAAHAILRMPLLEGPLAKSTNVTVWASEYGNHLDNLMEDFTNIRSFCHGANVTAELHVLPGDRSKLYWRNFIRESLEGSNKTVSINYFTGHGCKKGLCINASEYLSYSDLQEEFQAMKTTCPKFNAVFGDFCHSGVLAEDHQKAVANEVSSAAQMAVVAACSSAATAWEGRGGGFFTQCFLQCLREGMPLGLLLKDLGGTFEGSFVSNINVATTSECTQYGCASFPRQWAATLQQIEHN